MLTHVFNCAQIVPQLRPHWERTLMHNCDRSRVIARSRLIATQLRTITAHCGKNLKVWWELENRPENHFLGELRFRFFIKRIARQTRAYQQLWYKCLLSWKNSYFVLLLNCAAIAAALWCTIAIAMSVLRVVREADVSCVASVHNCDAVEA